MMRRSLFALFALLFGTAFALAQSLDIDVEGPWIYYVDDQFKDDAGQIESVLIAMTPYVPGHQATFSTGDGYTIDNPGVYCVGFDDVCAPRHSGNKPAFPGKLLRVKAPNGWYWHDRLDQKAIYLILPLPDSYSNDGVYRMKFGPKFKQYGPEKQHSIGLLLHYAGGPAVINLSSNCKNTTADSCPFDDYFQDQDNSGTLRIDVKAIDDPNDLCDNHVRDAYHRMLLAIDKGSLQGGNNVNQNYGYIDLPQYDTSCYQKDPQDDGSLRNSAMHAGDRPTAIDVTGQLRTIIADLNQRSLKDYNLLLPELTRETDNLKGQFPMFSQLAHIDLILGFSIANIDKLLLQFENKATDTTRNPDGDPTRELLKKAKNDEQILATYDRYLRSASSGKDCRVSEMLIK